MARWFGRWFPMRPGPGFAAGYGGVPGCGGGCGCRGHGPAASREWGGPAFAAPDRDDVVRDLKRYQRDLEQQAADVASEIERVRRTGHEA